MRTSSAAIDLKNGAAAGAEPVHAEGPFGTLDAQGFTVTDKGAAMQFAGPAHLVHERAQPMIDACGAAVALLTACCAASARRRGQQLDLSHGGPIEVTATDGIEWRQNEQEVIARGNAKAVRENVTVTADRLIAHYRKKAGARSGAAEPLPRHREASSRARSRPGRRRRRRHRYGGNEIYRRRSRGQRAHLHARPTRPRATTRSMTSTRRCW